MVNNGYQVIAVGWIQADNTVKGGTGWGVELAKLFNRPLSVYDQDRKGWFSWENGSWVANTPVIASETFAGTGTRNLSDDGLKAIQDLFTRSSAPRKSNPAQRKLEVEAGMEHAGSSVPALRSRDTRDVDQADRKPSRRSPVCVRPPGARHSRLPARGTYSLHPTR